MKGKIGVLILGAGESKRLGQPKQLLLYQGKTLLEQTIQIASYIDQDEIVVILGAHQQQIIPVLKNFPIQILNNSNWQEGIGSSIRLGIQYFQDKIQISGVLLLVCDQIFLSSSLLQKIILGHQNTEAIVACKYKNTIGVPALFPRKYFLDLLNLKGKEGAKKLLFQLKPLVLIPFFGGEVDIDSPQDLRFLEE